jgi:hypothetical protein
VGIYEDILNTENLKAVDRKLGRISHIDCFTRIFFLLNAQELRILFYGLAPGGLVRSSMIFKGDKPSTTFSKAMDCKRRVEVIRCGYWRLLLVMQKIKDLKNNELSSIMKLVAIIEEKGWLFHRYDAAHVRDSFHDLVLSMAEIKYLPFYVVFIR